MRDQPAPEAGPPPDAATLHAAALRHLARFSATGVTLTRVLDRAIDRWARTAAAALARDSVAQAVAAARHAAREVVANLVASGVVNDAAFAEQRARRLTRAGRSHRAAAAHLSARGVTPETLRAAVPDDADSELAAAVAFARRRRFGPFRPADTGADTRRRELAAMARAGFAAQAARGALAMSASEAEAVLARLRQA